MKPYEKPARRVPAWMTIVIVITMLPVVAFPTLLSAMSEGSEGRVYLWLYPAYVLATGILAYQCYGRRTEMTWILLVLMILTHLAIYFLSLER